MPENGVTSDASNDRVVSKKSCLGPWMIGSTLADDRFREVVEVFLNNLDSGLERAGAAFAVYIDGKPAVHVWGGWKNKAAKEEWTGDTMSVLFSTTKCLSAIVLAWVLQENDVEYTEKVVKFWPEYGQHGKERTTIEDIALHRAGLPYGETPLSREAYQDHEAIVRRIDPEHRGVWAILDEEMLRPNGISDLSMGLRRVEDNERVATLSGPDQEDMDEEARVRPESLRLYNLSSQEYLDGLYSRMPWILPTAEDVNKLENRLLAMPSNMGIGSAAAFAQHLGLIATGKILNEKTLARLSAGPVLENEMDIINGYPESKGWGFQYTKSPKGVWQFGHSGLGGQNVRVDTSEKMSIAYICNGMKIADADMVEPWKRLVDKVYECLDK